MRAARLDVEEEEDASDNDWHDPSSFIAFREGKSMGESREGEVAHRAERQRGGRRSCSVE